MKSRIWKVVLVVFIVFATVFSFFYINYIMVKVNGQNAAAFEKELMPAIKAGAEIDLSDVTPFRWEKLYYFQAYTPPAEMYKATGTKWTNNSSFIGYLFFNDFEKELVDDVFYALVFMDEGRVVCHYTGMVDKFGFDIAPQKMIKVDEAKFKVGYKDGDTDKKYPVLKITRTES